MDSIDNINKKPIDDEDRANARMYWDKVYSTNIDVQDFSLLMRQISNRYVQYQAHKIMRERIEALSTATNDQDAMVKKIREDFFKIEGIDLDPYTLTMGMDEGMTKVLAYLKEKRENPVDNQVVLTGLKAIDDVYCGLEFGTYTVITGMINGGKTTLMFNIAFNMAKAGYNVVYVSLEKKAVPFYARLLSLHALVDYNRIRRGGKSDKGLDDFHYSKLQEAAKDL
jgi:replicative DNA helicase